METYSTEEDTGKKEKELNLITHVSVQPANEHDANALIPAVADVKLRGLGPKKILADTLYGSDVNCQAAKVASGELIAPVNKGKGSNLFRILSLMKKVILPLARQGMRR